MSSLQVFAWQPSPTGSVTDVITAFREHPAFFQNAAILQRILSTWNEFGAITCSFEISDKYIPFPPTLLSKLENIVWSLSWVFFFWQLLPELFADRGLFFSLKSCYANCTIPCLVTSSVTIWCQQFLWTGICSTLGLVWHLPAVSLNLHWMLLFYRGPFPEQCKVFYGRAATLAKWEYSCRMQNWPGSTILACFTHVLVVYKMHLW